jgi:hypothetical protein
MSDLGLYKDNGYFCVCNSISGLFIIMKFTTIKLTELEKELKQILKEAQSGKIGKADAADKIMHLREEMDKVIEHLKKSS